MSVTSVKGTIYPQEGAEEANHDVRLLSSFWNAIEPRYLGLFVLNPFPCNMSHDAERKKYGWLSSGRPYGGQTRYGGEEAR